MRHNFIGLNVKSDVLPVRLSEASTQKRTRRRVAPTVQPEQPKVDNKPAIITSSLPSPPIEPLVQQRCKRHRSSFSPSASLQYYVLDHYRRSPPPPTVVNPETIPVLSSRTNSPLSNRYRCFLRVAVSDPISWSCIHPAMYVSRQ